MMETKLSYTLKEAASLLSLGMTKMREAVAAGQLPTFRVGRRVLVTRAALEQFVKSRTADQVMRRRPTMRGED